MILRKRLSGVPGIILAFGVLGIAAFAQEAPTKTPSQDGLRRDGVERTEGQRQRLLMREGMRERKGMGRQPRLERLAQELKLSEEQRQQRRAIMQRRLEGMKSQREELFRLREKRIAGTFNDEDTARARAIHEEFRTAMKGTRAEMEGVLNAEQRAQLDQLKSERKQRMEERLKLRQERLKERQERLRLM